MLLEPKLVIDSAADFTNKSLKWGPWNEEIGRLLISFDLSEGYGTRVEPWLLSHSLRHGIGLGLGGLGHLALAHAGALLRGSHGLGWNFL